MQSNNDLHSHCCNQDDGSIGVAKPGGQDREEETRGAKPLEWQVLGVSHGVQSPVVA
jgi:hypothetical protein